MFLPSQIIFEKGTLEYEMGKKIYQQFVLKEQVEIIECATNKVKSYITQETASATYQKGKKTLVVSKKKPGAFQTCKPSADFMLPLVSGCMGQCEYCYLHTQLGDKPFVRVNVNVEDILEKATKYIKESPEKIITFEGSATSDPLCVEPYTGGLEKTIEFFAREPRGAFRLVTKFNDVDTLLKIEHKGKTEVRFSLNTKQIRDTYEHTTASISARINAAAKMIEARYPVGFLIAPVFLYDNWKEEYASLLSELEAKLPKKRSHELFFEVISHRFTPRAKQLISEIFPTSTLPMEEEVRQYKYGQFGYGKYVYPKEEINEMKEFFHEMLPRLFPNCSIKYVI